MTGLGLGSDRFVLKKGVSYIESDGDVALFSYFGERVLIRGDFVPSILEEACARLKDPQSHQALVEAFRDRADGGQVLALFRALDESRLLERASEGDEGDGPDARHPIQDLLRYFCSSETRSSAFELRRVLDFRISIVAIESRGGCGAELREALADCGFSRFLESDEADLSIVAASWGDLGKLRELNAVNLERGKRWLPILSDFFGGTVGPLLGTESGPCFECLLGRRNANLAYPEYRPSVEEARGAPVPAFSKLLARYVAIETLKLACGGLRLPLPKTFRGAYEFDFLNYRSEFHDVLPLPFCPACSQALERPPEDIYRI